MRRATAYTAIVICRSSRFISIHFVAFYCWSVCCSRKLQKNY